MRRSVSDSGVYDWGLGVPEGVSEWLSESWRKICLSVCMVLEWVVCMAVGSLSAWERGSECWRWESGLGLGI